MKIALLKYNAGNTQSVIYALERLGIQPILTNDAQEIMSADKVIFPGVGNASSAMKSLQESGLDKIIPILTQPVLAICVGMQLLCRHSEENDTPCLGIVNTVVKRFDNLKAPQLKVPQMGWNSIYQLTSPLFENVPEQSYVYYVHSYYVPVGAHSIALTDYIQPYSAALRNKNFYGVQFHAEKSAQAGEKILNNFLAL